MKQRRQFGRKSALKPAAKPTFRLEALERRLLFSADLPFVVDGLIAVDPNNSHIVSVAGSLQAAVNDDAVVQPVQLVIIDAATPDYESIIADLEAQTGATFEIYVLDAEQDGIAQISALLAEHANVSALHLISHGSDGQIALGDSSLSLVDLLARADEVALWQDSFTIDGDFLIYGCDLASTDAGKNFVTTLSQLTGADVAASIDLTGAAEQGGDWQLEYTTGAVETRVAVSDALQSDYQHSLATYTVTTLADTGAGSLRQAILDANASAGADRIEFAVAGTISLTSGLPSIDQQLDLDASAMAGAGGVPGVILDGAAAGDTDGLLFDSGSDGSSVKGLAIVNFDRNGIYLLGSNNHSISANYIGTDGAIAQANGGAGIWLWNSASNTLGGTLPVRGNVISGNGLDGISLVGPATTNNNIVGNYIGTAANGTDKVANLGAGISISAQASFNVVGGALANQGNLISGNGGDGIVVQGLGTNNNDIYRNYIGTTIASDAALGNSRYGVFIYDGAQNTRVGGDAAGEGNVISGNASSGVVIHGNGGLTTINNIVTGNFIGTDSTGVIAVANGEGGVRLYGGASNNTIGSSASRGNVISGNNGDGVTINGSLSIDNHAIGNYIGVDVSGNLALGNTGDGVSLEGGTSGNFVGGDTVGERNIVSANGYDGVSITGAGTNNNDIQGNYIGLDIGGDNALGNGSHGVVLSGGASNNIVGGANPGERNIISGNTYGVYLWGAGTSGNQVAGNYIGTDRLGASAVANTSNGVRLSNSAADNVIGGEGASEGNVISGNTVNGVEISGAGTDRNIVSSNYIGTAADGITALGNQYNGVNIVNGAQDTVVGSSDPASGNVISGNRHGVHLFGTTTANNSVLGNYIGTDSTGSIALGNLYDGVRIDAGSSNNTVGGSSPAERNIISGNGSDGIEISGVESTDNIVIGNYIGSNSSGAGAVANIETGIRIGTGANSNTIGGNPAVGEGNLISGNAKNGVLLAGFGVDNNSIYGNYIGTNATGTLAIANANDGIWVGGGASLNRLGGSGAGEGNLISGNAGDGISVQEVGSDGNIILGNTIGANVDGTNALSNGESGVQLSNVKNTTVGGSGSGQRNLISGNGEQGVVVSGAAADNNRITGNYIGTNSSGLLSISNTLAGIQVTFGAQSTIIGGAASGEGNVISGNLDQGIELSEAGTIDTRIYGNFIGTTFDGNTALANSLNGVGIANGVQNTWLGGGNAGERNIISGNGENGVAVTGNGGNTTINNFIAGNYIGTNAAGTAAVANAQEGIYLDTGASNTLIGGNSATGNGNLISGNTGDGIYMQTGADANIISGNIIGLTANGGAALGNDGSGIVLDTAANSIGAPALGAGNIISANGENGILLLVGGSGTVIVGNTIGLDTTGTIAFGNAHNGIYVESDNNRIGGVTAVERNLISGNGLNGIELQGVGSNSVIGNYIGTDVSGTLALANQEDGIHIASGSAGNTIGGDTVAERNVISGNGEEGIEIRGVGTDANVVHGNYIGITINGDSALGNGTHGIVVIDGAQSTEIGGDGSKGNIISGNTLNGVVISGTEASNTLGNVVSGNYIGTDATGMFAVGNGQHGILVSASGNTIGGDAGAGQGNVITGNGNAGIFLEAGADASIVTGNIVGLAVNGVLAIGNFNVGIVVHSIGNRIGGIVPGERNIISANGSDGIHLIVGGHDNAVMGNWIGTDVTGVLDRGNEGNGVLISTGGFVSGTANIIGLNLIAFNTLAGVAVPDAAMRDQSIVTNSIHSNGGLAIDLGVAGVDINVPSGVDATVHDLLNYPVISHVATDETASVTVEGTLVGAPGAAYRIEFYSSAAQDTSGHGEADAYLGFVLVTADASGNISFNETLSAVLPIGTAVSATATVDFENGDLGGTSEMAQNVLAERYNEAPVFTSPAAFSVDENTALVGSVVATDVDADNLQYALVGSTDDNLFSIDTNTGELSFQAAPDFEAAAGFGGDNTYNVTVQVDDGFGGVVTQLVTVTVNNIDEYSATGITDTDAGVNTVDENMASGASIGLTAYSEDLDAGDDISYSLTDNAGGRFSIDSVSGVVLVSGALDYEVSSSHVIVVQATSSDSSSVTRSFTIAVADVNDNAPVITSGQVFSVYENATVGDVVDTVLASDVDTVGVMQNWTISGGNADGIFQIDATTGEISIADVAKLDYETTNQYTLSITVGDGVATSAVETLVVNINNINEAPVFTSPAAFSIDENATLVGTVVTTDVDGGVPQYALVGSTDDSLFSIDAVTGELRFQVTANFEAPADAGVNNTYDVTVQVDDGLGGVVTQAISVTVGDVNDNAPVITSGQVFSVYENATVGDVVGAVLVSDADTVGVMQNWTISGGNADGIFQIDATTGEISIADVAKLDYETTNQYTLSIAVGDGVNTSNAETLVVNINNINEAPVFTSPAAFSIDENATLVGTVVTTDVDGGAPQYTLVGSTDDNLFSIDAASGELRFQTAANFEAPADAGVDNTYDVAVQVDDGLGGVMTQLVTVTVNNLNEFSASAITDTDTSVNTVGENAASGSGIGLTAFSEDPDSGDNISYSLLDNAGGRFSIDSVSGVVTVSGALDYEASSSHVIVVQATSSDSSSVTRSFSISVTDVNDNPPIIAPGQVFSIDENASAGDAVETVLVADADTVGAMQNWAINGGNTDGIFQINATTGEISIADVSKLDYETSSQYTLSIAVADGLNASNTETLVVNINDVNEAPMATADTLQAMEDTSLVINPLSDLLANDLDPDGDVLSVSAVTPPAHGILIDNLDGSWTYTPDSNYAGADRIQYQVSDNRGETRWVNVDIDVASVNDLPTISVAAAINVDENSNGIITQVQATDVDATKLTVSITGGADSEAFRVDSVTGYVSFISSPDYEVAVDADGDNRYELELTVSDNAGGSVSRQVEVYVNNVNEAPTVVATEFASAEGFTGSLGQVQMVDPDSGDVVVLTITGGSGQGVFEIDAQSGEIVQHDGAVAGVYTLEVQLTDNSGTVANAVLTIRIGPSLPATGEANGIHISDQLYSTSPTSESEGLSVVIQIVPDGDSIVVETAIAIDGSDSDESSAVEDSEDTADSEVVDGTSRTDNAQSPFDSLQSTDSRFDLRSLQNDTSYSQLSSSGQSKIAEQGGYELVLELLLEEAEELVESVNRIVDDAFGVSALSATLSPSMLAALDGMHSVTDQQEQQAAERMELIVTAGAAVSVSLTVGFVTWLLNSGSLLATALSTSPLWRPLDPVPILGQPPVPGEDDSRGAENA